MSSSEQLRNNQEQHKLKNKYSKNDDKVVYIAQKKVEEYLGKRFENDFKENNFYIEFAKDISYDIMYSLIRENNIRHEFEDSCKERTIKPDGGILYLRRSDKKDYRKVLLIAEVKRQGTNDIRAQEGKPRQAQGNAIERLGKNLIGIRAMLNHEKITPFVCFGWGCDFDKKEDFVLSKIVMMNDFYPLNKMHIFKKDGNSDGNSYAPVSMFFRKPVWTQKEMFDIMKEIAETSFRYYVH